MLFKICLIVTVVWPKITLTELSLLDHIAEETSRSHTGPYSYVGITLFCCSSSFNRTFFFLPGFETTSHKSEYVGSEVVTAVTPCSLVEFYQRFGGTYWYKLCDSTLKVEAVLSSETSMYLYQITRCRIVDDIARTSNRTRMFHVKAGGTYTCSNYCTLIG